MPATTAFERERLEVDALLASGIFSRAPNLAHLLTYVCSKYFDGAAEEIKEYNIAVEALGRSPEFDQKRDSIVRVEAHRLRKRLREYYEGDGAGHEIQIEIPSGQYTPRFVFRTHEPVTPAPEVQAVDESAQPNAETTDLAIPETALEIPSVPATPAATQPRGVWLKWAVIAAIFASVFATAGVFLFRQYDRPAVAPKIENPVSAAPLEAVRILAGVENGSYIDAFERAWQSDRYFDGGWVNQSPMHHIVLGTRDQELYRRRREGSFRYNIPLKPGVYELRLYFAESVFGDNNVAGGGETTRIFDVTMNGQPLLPGFDLVNDAGASMADIKVFKDVSPATDGKLHLEFRPNTNLPFVNAIELVSGIPGKIHPIRIVARDRGVKDNEGRYWDPDHYARGGQLIPRPQSAVPGPDPDLYRGERFGNLSYTIPVAQSGRYGVNLYFSENWFGPQNPGGGGIGSRRFDILVNGIALRRNFDIVKEAGGANRAATVSVHGVEPNHQGKVVISLIPSLNYACINALEIVDESK
jgi:hypothetical protein